MNNNEQNPPQISDDETTRYESFHPAPTESISDDNLIQEFIARDGLLERLLRHIDRQVAVQAIGRHYRLLREAAVNADQKMILGVVNDQLRQMEPSSKRNRYIRSLQRTVDRFSQPNKANDMHNT